MQSKKDRDRLKWKIARMRTTYENQRFTSQKIAYWLWIWLLDRQQK